MRCVALDTLGGQRVITTTRVAFAMLTWHPRPARRLDQQQDWPAISAPRVSLVMRTASRDFLHSRAYKYIAVHITRVLSR